MSAFEAVVTKWSQVIVKSVAVVFLTVSISCLPRLAAVPLRLYLQPMVSGGRKLALAPWYHGPGSQLAS